MWFAHLPRNWFNNSCQFVLIQFQKKIFLRSDCFYIINTYSSRLIAYSNIYYINELTGVIDYYTINFVNGISLSCWHTHSFIVCFNLRKISTSFTFAFKRKNGLLIFCAIKFLTCCFWHWNNDWINVVQNIMHAILKMLY